MNFKKYDSFIIKYILIFAFLAFLLINSADVFAAIDKIYVAFHTILLAILLSFVLNIIMSAFITLFKRTNVKILIRFDKVIALLCTFLTIGLIIYALFLLVIPEIVNAFSLLFNILPTYLDEAVKSLVKLFEDSPEITSALQSINIDWKTMFDNAISFLSSGLSNIVGTTLSITLSVATSLFNSILVIVFSIYLLLEKERIKRTIKRLAKLYLSSHLYRVSNHIYHTTIQTFSSFIAGQCIEAVILGTLCALGMSILNMPYAVMVGTLVGTINIIPIVGAYAGGAIGAFMVFTVNPMQAVGFVVYLIILQQFESNLIYPRVVGSSVGLPGIYVLASVMVFGSLAGIPGMFLGIPFVATIYKLSKTYIEHKETITNVNHLEELKN
ncbi:MAG: AI-2E family transporter [Erysipelotrichaceae bacterium]